MSYWYKKYNTIRCRSKSWEKEQHGFLPEGLSDSLIHSAYVYLYTGDVDLLRNITWCLKKGKRWNDKSDPSEGVNYRSQYSMTRDIYIACLSVLILTGDWIPEFKVKRKLWRPDFYFWIQWVRTKKDKYLKRYGWWAILNICLFGRFMPMYAKLLAGWMAYTTESKKVQNGLKKHVPEWNYLLRCLVGDKPDEQDVREYISREGFCWTSETGKKDNVELPLGNDYYVDKDLLIWIYT